MRRRLFVVGTDTEVGKTTVSVALLGAAAALGHSLLPYKPAVSGDLGPSSDHARLTGAVPNLELCAEDITLFRFERAVAPGLAEAQHNFFGTKRQPTQRASLPVLAKVLAHLEDLEARTPTDTTLIEGAGGLHVPMPSDTWLVEWISSLRATPFVVARAGLGTINHTILTVESLRAHGLPPCAFALSCTTPSDELLANDNRRVLEARLQLPCIGVLPHDETHALERPWLRPDWATLLGITAENATPKRP